MILREKTVSFHICTPCTLNCRLCATNSPLFKQKGISYFVSPETYRRELDELFNIYDYIENVSLGGGEPLIHKDLADIVDYTLQTYPSRIDRVRIIANGTLLPSDTLLKVLHRHPRDKFLFVIDDYGDVSDVAKPFVDVCERNQIAYQINHYHGDGQHCGGWVDLGALDSKRSYSEEEAQMLVRHCHFATWKCLYCFEGKLYPCPRAACGSYLHYFDLGADEYIDLFDKSLSLTDRKKIAAGFGTKAPQACYYCNGFDEEHSQRFPAGEQIT